MGSDLRTDQIRKRFNQASPGPWRHFQDDCDGCLNQGDHSICQADSSHTEACITLQQEHCHFCILYRGIAEKSDAEFIAHAWEDIQYLLGLVDQQKDQHKQ